MVFITYYFLYQYFYTILISTDLLNLNSHQILDWIYNHSTTGISFFASLSKQPITHPPKEYPGSAPGSITLGAIPVMPLQLYHARHTFHVLRGEYCFWKSVPPQTGAGLCTGSLKKLSG